MAKSDRRSDEKSAAPHGDSAVVEQPQLQPNLSATALAPNERESLGANESEGAAPSALTGKAQEGIYVFTLLPVPVKGMENSIATLSLPIIKATHMRDPQREYWQTITIERERVLYQYKCNVCNHIWEPEPMLRPGYVKHNANVRNHARELKFIQRYENGFLCPKCAEHPRGEKVNRPAIGSFQARSVKTAYWLFADEVERLREVLKRDRQTVQHFHDKMNSEGKTYKEPGALDRPLYRMIQERNADNTPGRNHQVWFDELLQIDGPFGFEFTQGRENLNVKRQDLIARDLSKIDDEIHATMSRWIGAANDGERKELQQRIKNLQDKRQRILSATPNP